MGHKNIKNKKLYFKKDIILSNFTRIVVKKHFIKNDKKYQRFNSNIKKIFRFVKGIKTNKKAFFYNLCFVFNYFTIQIFLKMQLVACTLRDTLYRILLYFIH